MNSKPKIIVLGMREINLYISQVLLNAVSDALDTARTDK